MKRKDILNLMQLLDERNDIRNGMRKAGIAALPFYERDFKRVNQDIQFLIDGACDE